MTRREVLSAEHTELSICLFLPSQPWETLVFFRETGSSIPSIHVGRGVLSSSADPT